MSLVWKIPLASRTQKLVLLALADNSNDEGVCWPSADYLAKKCNLTRTGVMNQVAALEKAHLLERTRSGRANQYQLFVTDFHDAMTAPDTLPDVMPRDITPTADVMPRDIRCKAHLSSDVTPVDTNHQEPSVQEPSPWGCGGILSESWAQWVPYRKKLGKCKDWEVLFRNQVEWLKQFDESARVEILKQSMRQGWQGLFPLRQAGHGTNGNGASGCDKMIWEKEYERVIARMKGIQDCYDAHRTWTQAHVDEFRKLKVRRDELRGKLGIML